MASSSVPLECVQHPPGVVVQIGPGCGSSNGFVCTQPASPPGIDHHVDIADGTAMPSKQTFMDLHFGEAHFSSGNCASTSSGIFGTLMLVAFGFAVWYRQKYYQVLRLSKAPHQDRFKCNCTIQPEHDAVDGPDRNNAAKAQQTDGKGVKKLN